MCAFVRACVLRCSETSCCKLGRLTNMEQEHRVKYPYVNPSSSVTVSLLMIYSHTRARTRGTFDTVVNDVMVRALITPCKNSTEFPNETLQLHIVL